MTFTPKQLLIAGVLAASGAVAIAQTQPPAPAAPAANPSPPRAMPGERKSMRDPAERRQRMQERHTRHQAELKSALKLTPAQEGAWSHFSAAMQPPDAGQRPPFDREALQRMTTPQRLDLMEKHAAERQARMKQRADAARAFYGQLTPEQQKVFDERAMPHHERRGEGRRAGGHRGPPAPR